MGFLEIHFKAIAQKTYIKLEKKLLYILAFRADRSDSRGGGRNDRETGCHRHRIGGVHVEKAGEVVDEDKI